MAEETPEIIEWLNCTSCSTRIRTTLPDPALPDDYDPEDMTCPICSVPKMRHGGLSYRGDVSEIIADLPVSPRSRQIIEADIQAIEEGEAE